MKYWAVIGMFSILAAGARGQVAAPADTQVDDAQKLISQLHSPSKTERQSAIDDLHDIVKKPGKTIVLAAKDLVPAMVAAGDYADVEPLAMAVFRDRAFDTTAVDAVQRCRPEALMLQGKTAEALAQAKVYYNVALMKNTALAVQGVQQALTSNNNQSGAVKFAQQQLAHPPAGTTQPSADYVLSAIKIDGSPYTAALNSLGGIKANGAGVYSKLMSRGNLLLLSDRPAEARESFEAACQASDPAHAKDLHEAVEGVARAMRAETGSVESSNAFLLALRAKDPDVSAKLVGDAGRATLDDFAKASQAVKLADLSQ